LDPVEERVVHGNYRAPTDADDESGSGRFDARVVVRMIQTRQAAIRACYERELRSDPTLHGSIRISLTIQESGAVVDVRATENSMGNAEVASCIADVIQRFRFTPGPDGGSVTFQFPFAFEPQE
jgi:TonB family protein